MKFKGTIIGEASGSFASLTFSRNRGGQYIRQRAVPTNPGTPFQSVIRGNVNLLANSWTDVLSSSQREGWEVYAVQVPLPDKLGELRNVGGLAMYTRSNVSRLQGALPRLDDAPTIFDLGEFTPVTFVSASVIAQTVTVAINLSDAQEHTASKRNLTRRVVSALVLADNMSAKQIVPNPYRTAQHEFPEDPLKLA